MHLHGNELIILPYQSILPLRNLKNLGLSFNKLSELPRNAFPVSLHSLNRLNLANNLIINIANGALVQLKDLIELNLSGNKMKTLSSNSLEGLRSLQILDLSDNLIDKVPFESLIALRKLRKIYLSSNRIQTLDENGVHDLPNLEHLDLSRNMLINLGGTNFFTGLTALKSLDLSYNLLNKMATFDDNVFNGLSKLEILDLSDNQLESISSTLLAPLINLRKLFLDYNKLTTLSDDVISKLSNLDELSLAFNLVKILPPNIASKMTNLRLINLHGNRIDYITQDRFELIADNILGLDIGFNDLLEIPHLIMPKLMILNLAMNQFTSIGNNVYVFADLPSIRHLNLSANMINYLPSDIFAYNSLLEVIDLRNNLIDKMEKEIFVNNSMTSIILSSNRIKELSINAFSNLSRLTLLDLSDNQISTIKHGSFNDLPSLKVLHLQHNQLTSFKGDFFTTKTRIEEINLCNNEITYLYPNSFIIHRQLKVIRLCNNRIAYFATDILKNLKYLQKIDLSNNKLHSLDSADYSNMISLKFLNLANNQINFIGGNTFANSTLLQEINLSNNKIHSLERGTFKGIARLQLDLSNNQLNSLADDLFSRSFVYVLESISLSGNNFTQFPVDSLHRQYSTLEKVDVSRNQINSLRPHSDLLVNIKQLDLSHNPLTIDAHKILFGEPKSVRKLNVAFTGINSLPEVLETPFLQHLNLSGNNLTHLKGKTMDRVNNMLIVLDLSHNKLNNLNAQIDGLWNQINSLQQFYAHNNPIQYLVKGDLIGLTNLKVLDLSNLPALTHFDCDTLANLHNLQTIYLYGYPSLHYLPVQECLSQLNTKLHQIGIELKESTLQGHLQRIYSSQIQQIIISGKQLTTLSANSLMGIRSASLTIKLINTSVKQIPHNLFAPLPMSTKVDFILMDNDSMIDLNYQLLDALDTRQMNVQLKGIYRNNNINCDCHMEPLWRWINERLKYNLNSKYYASIENMENITCSSPEHLKGYRLLELNPEDLTCDDNSLDSLSSLLASSSSSSSSTNKPTLIKQLHTIRKTSNQVHNHVHQTRKPDMILSGKRPINHRNIIKARSNEKKATLTKVDTMIIGIAAGVIAFVCILILIICIIRLKSSSSTSSTYPSCRMDAPLALRAAAAGGGGGGGLGGGGCTCLKPYPNSCGACYTSNAISTSKGMFMMPQNRPISYINNVKSVPIKMNVNHNNVNNRFVNNTNCKPSYYVPYLDVDSDAAK